MQRTVVYVCLAQCIYCLVLKSVVEVVYISLR